MSNATVSLDLVLNTADHDSVEAARIRPNGPRNEGLADHDGGDDGVERRPRPLGHRRTHLDIDIADDVLSPYSRAPTVLVETFADVDAVRVGFLTDMTQADKERTLDALEPLVA